MTIKNILRDFIGKAIGVSSGELGDFDVSIPDREELGHYATNVAMRLAKEQKKNPLTIAQELAEKISAVAPDGFFETVDAVAPGFVNMKLSQGTFHKVLQDIFSDTHYGISQTLAGKTVMIEFTDANPFKLFHIGHLMSNSIGEALCRLHEAVGAKVLRANYQGDVGTHVAMAVWGIQNGGLIMPSADTSLSEKVEFLGKAYAIGSKAYRSEEDPNSARLAIDEINKKIYERSDEKVNALYDTGRAWSLDYFEHVYARLGTKFAHYFFESEVNAEGRDVVLKHPDVFTQSDGAVVFKGEPYGLHTRVFINSRGLPTYEAKELGLNKKKFELYPLDLSIIVTADEILEYFHVLMKVMELVLPDVAKKTRHVPHGILSPSTGKMSSRTGDVITADSLIDQTKEKLKLKEGEDDALSSDVRAQVREQVAIGALKYSILRQNPGRDVIFDFDTSLSFEGDSGVYVQYTYARLRSILRKSNFVVEKEQETQESGDVYNANVNANMSHLNAPIQHALLRKLVQFPDVVAVAIDALSASPITRYLFELANTANHFYQTTPILKEDDAHRRLVYLSLITATTDILKRGLDLLGIKAPEAM